MEELEWGGIEDRKQRVVLEAQSWIFDDIVAAMYTSFEHPSNALSPLPMGLMGGCHSRPPRSGST